MSYLLEALAKKLEGQVAVAEANILAYTRNPVGIGEHSEIVEPYLIKIGFLTRTPRGRLITALGKKYIDSKNDNF